MLTAISNWFYKISKWWLILIFLGLFIGMMYIIPMIPIDPGLSNNESLDLPSFNTPAKIYSLLESYGSTGRTQIIWLATTWDLVFPISYTMLFGILISWLLQRGVNTRSIWRKLNLVVLGGVFDLLENTCTVLLVLIFPTQLIVLAWLKTIFTMIKYGFGLPIFVVLIFALLKASINRFRVQG